MTLMDRESVGRRPVDDTVGDAEILVRATSVRRTAGRNCRVLERLDQDGLER